jgi:hypothetical protein
MAAEMGGLGSQSNGRGDQQRGDVAARSEALKRFSPLRKGASLRRRIFLLTGIIGLLTGGMVAFGPSRATAAPSTGASFVSEAGDFLGQGEIYEFPTVTYTGLRAGYPTFSVSNSTDQFDVWFAAPAGEALVPGAYTDAENFDLRSAGFPGIDVFGDGRGCDQIVGSFTVYDATYDGNGDVLSFAAQFFIHCEGHYPALMGNISYNSDTTIPPIPASAPEPSQSAQLLSQRGDYLGQGRDFSFPIAYPLGQPNNQGPTRWELATTPEATSFEVFLMAAGDAPLAVGTYTNTTAVCPSPVSPCLSVSGEGRGCDTESGSFTVYDVSYDSLGMVDSFAAEFTDHCGAANAPSLSGSIRWNSTVTMPPLLVNADTATGTAGTKLAFTLVSLNTSRTWIQEVGKLPVGIRFVENHNRTASLIGTPGPKAGGVYSLTFKLITHTRRTRSAAKVPFSLIILESPAFTSDAQARGAVGRQLDYIVRTRGYPRPSIGESGVLPAGISMTDNDDGTATVAGIPESGTAGSYPVTLTATTGVGGEATQLFLLKIVS